MCVYTLKCKGGKDKRVEKSSYNSRGCKKESREEVKQNEDGIRTDVTGSICEGETLTERHRSWARCTQDHAHLHGDHPVEL